MRVLVVGNGGREHALAWAIRRSPLVEEVYAAPGNPGIAQVARLVPIAATDVAGLADWAREHRIDLTVVGPEAPLVAGIADRFLEEGLAVVGPTQRAAALEGSKAFAKELMQRHGIPTAAFRVCTSSREALEAVEAFGAPVVVKADGLAAGKGVAVCRTLDEAKGAIRRIMEERVFGAAGVRVVVEEFLEGEEASVLAFVDGEHVVAMVPAQDHKAAYDGDRGPNTGGMGAYSPAPVVTPELQREVEERILRPVVRAMAQEGRPYRGILYAGLMVTPQGPKVVEFNCRFGDPEAQAILPRLRTDLVPVLWATAQGSLAGTELAWDGRACVTVVLASGGYPGEYATGLPISGLAEAAALEDVLIFHAGTRREGDTLVTAGGRVLAVSALGESIGAAVARAYEAVSRIRFDGMHYRRDIAHRALGRTQVKRMG